MWTENRSVIGKGGSIICLVGHVVNPVAAFNSVTSENMYLFSHSFKPRTVMHGFENVHLMWSQQTFWNITIPTSRYGRRVFVIRNTWFNQRSLLSWICCDRIFSEPESNARFLSRALRTRPLNQFLAIRNETDHQKPPSDEHLQRTN